MVASLISSPCVIAQRRLTAINRAPKPQPSGRPGGRAGRALLPHRITPPPPPPPLRRLLRPFTTTILHQSSDSEPVSGFDADCYVRSGTRAGVAPSNLDRTNETAVQTWRTVKLQAASCTAEPASASTGRLAAAEFFLEAGPARPAHNGAGNATGRVRLFAPPE